MPPTPLPIRVRIAALFVTAIAALGLALWVVLDPAAFTDGHPLPLVAVLLVLAVVSLFSLRVLLRESARGPGGGGAPKR